MSDFFVTTSYRNFGFAAADGLRRKIKIPRTGARIENFFDSYDELTAEFPAEGIRRIFVDVGPGSFTGVRVGVTFARVISQQLKIPVVPVKSLDILSVQENTGASRRLFSPLIDAGNGLVYATLFEDGRKKEDDYIVALSEWLDFLNDSKDEIHFCGDLSENDTAQIKERNFIFEAAGIEKVVEKMIAFSGEGFVKAYQFNDILPCYLGAEKWREKMEREFAGIKEIKEKKRSILAEIQEEKQRLLTEVERLNRSAEKQERRLNDISIGADALLRKKNAVKGETDRLNEEISVLSAKRTAYSESVKQQRNIMSNLNEIINNLKQRVAFFEDKIKEKRGNLEKLKELPPEISDEIALYVKQRDSLRSEVENLREEVSKYSKELDEIASARFEKVFSGIRKEEGMLGHLSEMRRKKEDELKHVEFEIREMNHQKLQGVEEIDRLERRIEALRAEASSPPEASAPPEIREIKIENFRYEIRPFKEDNIPEVMSVEEASFQRPWGRQMFKEELSISVSKLFCIFGKWGEHDPFKLFGYAVFWTVAGKAHIINFAVAPEERRKGVGKILLCEILKKAKTFECKTAYLEVRVSATFMQRLVAGAGFKKVGLRKDYFGYPREDAIIYEMRI
ncbi:MAG: ribosomal protein S18-alanine N-acetyltransferase [bacterium]